ncbi:MAG: ABC transporter transmembrane domain-containing protein [Algoriphagus aquaeductus]|uniref:ABC transporter transmembrane domain-containing protein n=1 Tax=Algoriphagus TaxID=246875 RepID=UPI0025847A31|nr:ABC transporter transmembrane domain-containing protein [Algoriphagus sp.]
MSNWIKNKTLKRYWFGRYPRIWLYLTLGWFASLCTFFLSLWVGLFFDLYFQSSLSKTLLLEKSGISIDHLGTFFWIMGMVITLKFILQYNERKGIHQDVDRFIHYLLAKMYRRQLRQNPELFNSRPFSKYLLRYSGDLQPVRNLLAQGIHRGIRDVLFLLSGLALLCWLNFTWTLILAILSMVIFPIFRWLDQKQMLMIPFRRNQKNDLLHFVTESFGIQNHLHQQGKVEKKIQAFNQKNTELLQSNLQNQRFESLRHAGVNILGPLMVGIILFFSWVHVQNAAPGDLLAYLLVLGSLGSAVRNVVKAPEIIEKGMLSLKKIERLSKKQPTYPSPILFVPEDEKQPNCPKLSKKG